jgi:hypothetical protein
MSQNSKIEAKQYSEDYKNLINFTNSRFLFLMFVRKECKSFFKDFGLSAQIDYNCESSIKLSNIGAVP